jgi:N-acyl-D-aspartate/D-glutamate deacylase
MDVLTDQYPYDAYMTGLSVIILPAWANEGSPADTAARLSDPLNRSRVISEIDASDWDWSLIRVGMARKNRSLQGLTIAEIATRDHKKPSEAAVDLLIDEEGWVAAAHFAMSDADIDEVLRDPHTMIGSDGVATDPNSVLSEDQIHPRTYGTFPRVLSRYVRERKVISLAEAIRRMTSLPAQRLRFTDRGRIAAGTKADITVFDPTAITDLATFERPHQYPAGVCFVLVNGRVAIADGVQTDTLAGRVIRRA